MKSKDSPFEEGHSDQEMSSEFELTSNEPFVGTYVKGLTSSCCKSVISKLDQYTIFAIEDDLSNPAGAVQDNHNLADLLVCLKVKAVSVKRVACFASLPVT